MRDRGRSGRGERRKRGERGERRGGRIETGREEEAGGRGQGEGEREREEEVNGGRERRSATPTAGGRAMASISVPGFLDAENRNALDWREGLVAYGCQTLLCVVQVAAQPQLLQTLCGHKLRVALVCFSRREPRGSSLAEGEAVPLMLASADTSGHIILWDVLRGAALTQLTPLLTTSGKPSAVLCMHWLASRPGHLLCAHGSGSVLMWQCSHAGRKVTSLWRSELAEPATHLAFDPLCMTGERMSVYSARGVLRQLALSPSQLPRPAGPSCSVAQQAAATALQLEYSPHQAQQV